MRRERTILRAVLAAGLAAGAALPCRAAETTASFLKVGVGARPIAMGNAFTAMADDVNALHWNPAGLSQLRARELGATDARLFADTRLDSIGYAHPLRRGTLAFSSLYLSHAPIEERGAGRERLGRFVASDLALTVGYARPVTDRLSLGGSVKMIESRIAEASAQGWAADLGALVRGPGGVSLGLSLQNLGPGMTFLSETSQLPLTAAAGLAWRLPLGMSLTADYRRRVREGRQSFSAGAEFSLLSVAAIRAGYLSGLGAAASGGSRVDAPSGVGAGLGLRFGGFSVDYAFTPAGELGAAQRLSLGLRF